MGQKQKETFNERLLKAANKGLNDHANQAKGAAIEAKSREADRKEALRAELVNIERELRSGRDALKSVLGDAELTKLNAYIRRSAELRKRQQDVRTELESDKTSAATMLDTKRSKTTL
jgi:di/tripeptidase